MMTQGKSFPALTFAFFLLDLYALILLNHKTIFGSLLMTIQIAFALEFRFAVLTSVWHCDTQRESLSVIFNHAPSRTIYALDYFTHYTHHHFMPTHLGRTIQNNIIGLNIGRTKWCVIVCWSLTLPQTRGLDPRPESVAAGTTCG